MVVGCASSAVRPVDPQLLSHTNIDWLMPVSVWIFFITTRAEVLSDPDSKVVDEQPGRAKSALKAHDNPEAVTQWQQSAAEDGRQSQGMQGVPALAVYTHRSYSIIYRPGSPPNTPTPSTLSSSFYES